MSDKSGKADWAAVLVAGIALIVSGVSSYYSLGQSERAIALAQESIEASKVMRAEESVFAIVREYERYKSDIFAKYRIAADVTADDEPPFNRSCTTFVASSIEISRLTDEFSGRYQNAIKRITGKPFPKIKSHIGEGIDDLLSCSTEPNLKRYPDRYKLQLAILFAHSASQETLTPIDEALSKAIDKIQREREKLASIDRK